MINLGAFIKELMLMLALGASADANNDSGSKVSPEREPPAQQRTAEPGPTPGAVAGASVRGFAAEPEAKITAPTATSENTAVTVAPAASQDAPSLADHYDLALGHNHTCELANGDVACWGSSYYGQTDVPGDIHDVLDIAAADQNTCAVQSDLLTCWGIDGDYVFPVDDGIQVSTGGFHVCVIDAEGLWCDRGGNEYGELNIPASLSKPVQVAAGTTHTCAIGNDGVSCWGSNEFGEIDVPALENPTQIAAGGWYSCALDGDAVKCWGNNDFGQLDVPTLVEPTAIMAGHNHACAIDRYGLQCWGRNAFGQADVPSLIEPRVAQPGTHHSCAVEADGNTVCWGYNAQGQATPAG